MSTDLPSGYRWATEAEMDRADTIVVPRTADSEGHPYTQGEADLAVPVTVPLTCLHCGREVVLVDDRWVDPEATGDDAIWRETCDENDTERAAPHEVEA